MSKKRPVRVKAVRVGSKPPAGYFFFQSTITTTVNGKTTVQTERVEQKLVNGQWVDVTNNKQLKGPSCSTPQTRK